MSRHHHHHQNSRSISHPVAPSKSTAETGWGSWLRSVSSTFPSAASLFGGSSDGSAPSSPKPVLRRADRFSLESALQDDYPSDFEDGNNGQVDPYSRQSRFDGSHPGPSSPPEYSSGPRGSSPSRGHDSPMSPHVHYENQNVSPFHTPPRHAVRTSMISASTATTDTVVTTECQYHLRSLSNPSCWVGSLTLNSSAGYGIDDITTEEMNETILDMMKDWNSPRWQEVRFLGLSQPVWRGSKIVNYQRPEGGDPIEGQMVIYAPRQVIRGSMTGGVRITLCHKCVAAPQAPKRYYFTMLTLLSRMSIDRDGERLVSGLFLRHRDPKTNEWTWMVFDGFKQHPELDPVKVLGDML